MAMGCIICFGPYSILDNTFDGVHNKKNEEELSVDEKSESVLTAK